MSALRAADVAPASVTGLEMHGTGTPLGDPIEMGAATAVLPGSHSPVRMTAAKSRMGHAEPAAGVRALHPHFMLSARGHQVMVYVNTFSL